MKKEHAKLIADAHNIIANDGILQFKRIDDNIWENFFDKEDFFTISELVQMGMYELRAMPAKKRINLTKKDMLERIKNNKSMWIQQDGVDPEEIIRICDDCVIVHNTDIEYEDLAKHYVWVIDNTPCYKEL